MWRRLAAAAFLVAALAAGRASRAQQAAPSPRDVWPQATQAARDGDLQSAKARTDELLKLAPTYGIKTFPLYAASAIGLAGEEQKSSPDIAKWATQTAEKLDGNSPSVAFNQADQAARNSGWGAAIPLALKGFVRGFGDYRTNLLARADLTMVAALAIALTAIVFALALFIRYGRSMAHDFREFLGARMTGGSVTVLAFALLILPIFFWLGPIWLIFYWFAIFFPYASAIERIGTVVLLILAALLPIVADATANRVAGVDSPVVMAALSGSQQSYQPEALRRLQELVTVVPDHPVLHVLIGNLQAFEGNDAAAANSYRRAIELRGRYSGALVNLGNLYYADNEFSSALTQYEQAQKGDQKLAIAYYNASVASGDTYKFDQQKEMLARAREIDSSLTDRLTRNQPPQKVVMYSPPLGEAWKIHSELAKRPAARALFGNYSTFDFVRTAANPVTIGALVSLLLALFLALKRRRSLLANACIKCGRTFCHRCKSARESSTYCTQCIHIYLKRDGVSLDTKRKKLEEVTDYQTGMLRRNRLFATFLPGAAQMLEGRVIAGILGTFLFGLFVFIAVFVGRLAPALGPVAEVAQMLVRVTAIAVAVIIWLTLSLPVYRRRSAV